MTQPARQRWEVYAEYLTDVGAFMRYGRWRMPPKYAVLATVELLDAILEFLAFDELFRVRRVCKRWRDCIDGSPGLQQRMFLRPGVANDGDRVYCNGLSTVPIQLNPLLHRTFVLRREPGLYLSTTIDNTKSRVFEKTIPLSENALKHNPGKVYGCAFMEQCGVPGPSHIYHLGPEGRMKLIIKSLIEACSRPLVRFTEVQMPRYGVSLEQRRLPSPGVQASWLEMQVASPSIKDVMLHIKGQYRARLNQDGGLLLRDIAKGLEMLREWSGRSWPVTPGLGEERVEQMCEILVPVDGAFEHEILGRKVYGFWRPLKTRMTCRVEDQSRVDFGRILPGFDLC